MLYYVTLLSGWNQELRYCVGKFTGSIHRGADVCVAAISDASRCYTEEALCRRAEIDQLPVNFALEGQINWNRGNLAMHDQFTTQGDK